MPDFRAQLAYYNAVVRLWDMNVRGEADETKIAASWLDVEIQGETLTSDEKRKLLTRWAPAYAAERGCCPYCAKPGGYCGEECAA